VAVGRRRDRLEALHQELGDAVHTIELDVRDRDAVTALPGLLPPLFAQPTILVNNAGLALGLQPAHETDMDDWLTMIDTNVTGLVAMTRAVLPGMVARQRGHVVNMGSTAARYPYPGGNVYGGTKAFVHQFSLNLRADLLGSGVRVTVVEPGMAETEFSVVRLKDEEKAKAVYAGVKPLSADDVADVVFYVATLPEHINVNSIELMPTQQAFGPFAVHRNP
jgi:3-hydroxy acid dehydrogenase/malonic semialdehyde reductase